MQERIKALRKALNLTQAKFAEQLGVKPNTISQYESGRNEPIDAVVSLICREFNVDENWLRTGSGEMFKSSSNDVLDALIEQYGVSKGVRTLIESFLKLKPEQQEAVVTYVKQVASALNGNLEEDAPLAVPPPEPPPIERASDPLAALTKELTELKRQNQEILRQNAKMAAEIAAINEEDAKQGLAERKAPFLSQIPGR